MVLWTGDTCWAQLDSFPYVTWVNTGWVGGLVVKVPFLRPLWNDAGHWMMIAIGLLVRLLLETEVSVEKVVFCIFSAMASW